ncbi:MAG: glutamate--tRNA ligase [Bacteroidales bacterium]|nr:glutamate--tRNA ligase [Bacteroidales bacterium]MDD7082540.1 glutamate--tRNA ligase [Bacteroidales bacterium]MDY5262628.1 glutamate--tRNA ligase [Candidatus Cryptobacteroides sp.]
MERRTRVRFAPSPTGPLHMGGVRTALYNYLYAKQNGGDFIIRIEDTDSHRFVPGAERYIIEALNWCGIHPDEGVDADGNVVEVASEKHPHAPYRQSQRKGIYRSYADQLIANGYAYYAFDTAEELEAKRTAAESAGGTFIYNQKTRMELRNSLTLPEDEVRNLLETTDTWTIRFRMPENVVVKMDDLIRGHIEVNTDTLDDKVLWKRADELPTYHLANIVDDHLMEISEVIRGEEWLPSLPLHYMLYKAFGWEDTMPRFAHLSLLLKPDGKGKLSKRDGDRLGFPVFPLKWVNAAGEESRGYREDGYFPEAFVNMLAMLGWNPGDDRELFTMDELIGAFSLDRVIKSGARFNPDKARWYNKEYLRTKSDEEVTGMFIPMLESHGFNVVDCPACALTAGAEFAGKGIDFKNHIVTREYVAEVVSLVRERATFVKDIWEIAACLFLSPADYAAFGVKAGGPEIQKPVDPRRAADPRVKVFDDSLTAPFLAKDVDKFWKEENFTPAFQAQEHVCASGCAFTKESIEPVLEDYIREQGWPMGKVMNCIRLALTGASSGLGIADILSFIGSREFASRMAFAAERLGK